ncbi:hypothetical protein SCUP515_04531 [Seiridium cupressi]
MRMATEEPELVVLKYDAKPKRREGRITIPGWLEIANLECVGARNYVNSTHLEEVLKDELTAGLTSDEAWEDWARQYVDGIPVSSLRNMSREEAIKYAKSIVQIRNIGVKPFMVLQENGFLSLRIEPDRAHFYLPGVMKQRRSWMGAAQPLPPCLFDMLHRAGTIILDLGDLFDGLQFVRRAEQLLSGAPPQSPSAMTLKNQMRDHMQVYLLSMVNCHPELLDPRNVTREWRILVCKESRDVDWERAPRNEDLITIKYERAGPIHDADGFIVHDDVLNREENSDEKAKMAYVAAQLDLFAHATRISRHQWLNDKVDFHGRYGGDWLRDPNSLTVNSFALVPISITSPRDWLSTAEGSMWLATPEGIEFLESADSAYFREHKAIYFWLNTDRGFQWFCTSTFVREWLSKPNENIKAWFGTSEGRQRMKSKKAEDLRNTFRDASPGRVEEVPTAPRRAPENPRKEYYLPPYFNVIAPRKFTFVRVKSKFNEDENM